MLFDRLWWTAYVACQAGRQRRYPFRPLAAVRRDQARRVRRMVAYAHRHVPYYRETMDRLGLAPSDFQTAEDLAKLPILEREILQRDPERLLSDAARPERCFCARSSGSTGTPVTVYHDIPTVMKEAVQGERVIAVVRALLGKRFRYRLTSILSEDGPPARVRRVWRQKTFLPDGMPVRHQWLNILEPPEKNLPLLNAFRPDVIATSGSYLEMLFPYVHATGQPFHPPKVVLYGADGLSPSVRRLIQREFGAEVVSAYQAIEAPRLAWECERHSGLHVNIDLCAVRIADEAGHTLPAGEFGDVVISSLVNRATVLLNYRLGDVAALLPDPCPCGRSLPLMTSPQGRSDDRIVLPSGRTVLPYILYYLIDEVDPDKHIWQWQVVQETPGHFSVALVVDKACDHEVLRERVRRQLGAKLGESVTADVSFVDSIERTAGAKHRTVSSKVARAEPHDCGDEPQPRQRK